MRALDRSKAQGGQALFILFWVYPEQTGLPSAPRSSPVVAWWAKRTRSKTAYLRAWSSYAPVFALEWMSRNWGIRNFALSGASSPSYGRRLQPALSIAAFTLSG